MKHNCEYKDEDGEIVQPFLNAIMDGYIYYDDFNDAYLVHYCKEKRILFLYY